MNLSLRRWIVLVAVSVLAALTLAFMVARLVERQRQARIETAGWQELQALAQQAGHKNDPQLFYWLGIRLSEANRPKDAVLALARAVLLDPRSARSRYALGVALDQVERPQEAEAQLLEAIRLAPQAPMPEYVLGKLYGKYSRWQEAVTHLQRASQRAPNDPDIAFLLAISYIELAKRTHAPYREEARAILERLAQTAPDDLRVLRALAPLYVFFGQTAQAEALHRRIVQLDPTDQKTRVLLGRSLAEQAQTPADFAEAERLLQQCVREDPRSSAASMALGVLYFRQNQFAKATASLEKAVQLGVSEPEAWFYLGRAYALSGQRVESQRATALYTRKNRLRQTIRSLEMKLGFLSNTTAAEIKQQETLRAQLAQALVEDAQFAPALQHLHWILRQNPNHSEARRLEAACRAALESPPSPAARLRR